MKKTALVVVAAAVLCLAVWPSVAEEPKKPRLREVTATGNRDIITLDNDARFKGVILREKGKAVRLLTMSSSGRIYQVDIQLARIKRIERLTPEARKVARADIEADRQKKAEIGQRVMPATACFFWRAPHGGVFGHACDSLLRKGGYAQGGGLSPPHYLTDSGIHLMRSRGYVLIELRLRTFIAVDPRYQPLVDQWRQLFLSRFLSG